MVCRRLWHGARDQRGIGHLSAEGRALSQRMQPLSKGNVTLSCRRLGCMDGCICGAYVQDARLHRMYGRPFRKRIVTIWLLGCKEAHLWFLPLLRADCDLDESLWHPGNGFAHRKPTQVRRPGVCCATDPKSIPVQFLSPALDANHFVTWWFPAGQAPVFTTFL